MTLIAPHIAAFLQQRLPVERRASPNTCDSYAHAFKLLFQYASQCLKVPPSELNLEQIDASLIVNFLGHLEAARGNGAGSRNIRLAAIKSFMHFMEYRVPSALEQIQRILAIPAKKTDSRLVRHLTAEEMQSILDAPDPKVRDGLRDRAMLHLCFAGGLRVSELVGLRLEDLLLQPQASILVHGKGRKERCLPLWKETASALRAWLSVRGAIRTPELFPNARNVSMTRAGSSAGRVELSTSTRLRAKQPRPNFPPAMSKKLAESRAGRVKNEYVLASAPLAGFEVTTIGRF